MASRGFYADPSSPVASSPDLSRLRAAHAQHHAGGSSSAAAGGTSAGAAATATSSWGASLFSPVLSLLGGGGQDPQQQQHLLEEEEEEHVHASSTPPRGFDHEDLDGDEDVDEDGAALQHFLEFDPFLFIAQLPPYETVCDAVRFLSGLPAQSLTHSGSDRKRHALVLDLDETLVHCTSEPTPTYDITFSVEFNGTTCQVFVKKRPHLDAFLEAVSRMFEVTVFTASQRVYAERLLDILDPHKKYVHHRLYRDSCLMVQGNLLKDLNVLSRDLAKTVIVDNSIHAFGYHTCNGIPIESWFDNEQDTELLKLIPFLQRLQHVDDVRPHIRESFGVGEMVRRAASSLQYHQQQIQQQQHMLMNSTLQGGSGMAEGDLEMMDERR